MTGTDTVIVHFYIRH